MVWKWAHDILTIWSGGSFALFDSIAPAVKTGSFDGSARNALSHCTDCRPVLLLSASRSASSPLWYEGSLSIREACDFMLDLRCSWLQPDFTRSGSGDCDACLRSEHLPCSLVSMPSAHNNASCTQAALFDYKTRNPFSQRSAAELGTTCLSSASATTGVMV